MSTPAAASIKEQATTPAAGKKAARIAQQSIALERRRILIVCGGLFAILGSGIVLALTTDLSGKLLERALVGPRDTFGIEERSGSIILPAANNRCRQIAFNNDTGRMVETTRPCETKPALDDKGIPVPEATIRRLESIKQGFFK